MPSTKHKLVFYSHTPVTETSRKMIYEYTKENQIQIKLKANSSLYIVPSSETEVEILKKVEIHYSLHSPIKLPTCYYAEIETLNVVCD